MRRLSILSAAAALFTVAQPGVAAQIVLNESAVIGSTGGFNATYTPGNIFDRQTGIITELHANGEYWLNSDSGPTDAFITIDLGQATLLGRFDLFNTTNGFSDRGTAKFEILASNSVANTTHPKGMGKTLGADAVTLVSGTLAPATGNVREAQSFGIINGGVAYRYLQFKPTTALTNSYTPFAYGLNELRVFDGPVTMATVPEPATWGAMLLGFGLIGGMARRRRADVALA